MSAEEGLTAGFRGPELKFDTNDPQFVRGFELGRFWAYLKENPTLAVNGYMHASNTEMVLRLAEVAEREVVSEELDDNWLFVTFSPKGDSLESIDRSNIKQI